MQSATFEGSTDVQGNVGGNASAWETGFPLWVVYVYIIMWFQYADIRGLPKTSTPCAQDIQHPLLSRPIKR